MSLTRIEALSAGQVGLADEARRPIGCWLRDIVARPFTALVKMTYRSSRFWSVYMG